MLLWLQLSIHDYKDWLKGLVIYVFASFVELQLFGKAEC